MPRHRLTLRFQAEAGAALAGGGNAITCDQARASGHDGGCDTCLEAGSLPSPAPDTPCAGTFLGHRAQNRTAFYLFLAGFCKPRPPLNGSSHPDPSHSARRPRTMTHYTFLKYGIKPVYAAEAYQLLPLYTLVVVLGCFW